MAEEVGFEPTEPCGSPVFKTGALDRSATPPEVYCGRATPILRPRDNFKCHFRCLAAYLVCIGNLVCSTPQIGHKRVFIGSHSVLQTFPLV